MKKPFVFVSCGQYTESEKALGKSIVETVKKVTGLDAFFAEEVQDLNGLETNILNALRDCVGLVVVMHPRGEIIRPDGSHIIRASVWIEQEIAIATYIQRVEKRGLPIIAFRHEAVDREGIRDLLHLNPMPFGQEGDVLVELPERLRDWRALTPAGIHVLLQVEGNKYQDRHLIRQLAVNLVNDSNQRIGSFNCEVRVPAALLKHWNCNYAGETSECDPGFRCFRRDEVGIGPVSPRSTKKVFGFDYCTECAVAHIKDDPRIAALIVEEYEICARIWVDNREYSDTKAIKELAQGASAK